MTIRVFRGSFQLGIRRLYVIFGLFGMPAQFVFVCFLCCICTVPSFDEMFLGSCQILVLVRIDVFHRMLGEQNPTTNQARAKDTTEKDIFPHVAPLMNIQVLWAAACGVVA